MVSTELFYGETLAAQRKIESILSKKPIVPLKRLPLPLASLLGPSRTWKVFKKQSDAIQFAKYRGSGLKSFAYQHSNDERSFLVCHPVMLWFVHSSRPSNEKSTYEIITEGAKCKLYLDIEFEFVYNANCTYDTGQRMVKNYLEVLKNFCKEVVGLDCQEDEFLDLDSSTSHKFSRHIILNSPEVAFVNNYAVGNVVKSLGCMITEAIRRKDTLYGVSNTSLQELVISDRKGQQKIFVDTSVYTKNRHFRLLGSTKLNKNAPLVVSHSNQFKPSSESAKEFFLASLITFFATEPKTLDFGAPAPKEKSTGMTGLRSPLLSSSTLDSFITQVVAPAGKIRRRIALQGRIQYDIAGYRHCGNIGREHRSNNICLVVDLQHLWFYQTCYDPDCKGFASKPADLPPDVSLPQEDDSLLLELTDHTLSDQDLLDFINGADNIEIADAWSDVDAAILGVSESAAAGDAMVPTHEASTLLETAQHQHFPDMNVSDEQMMATVDSTDDVWLLDDSSFQ